MRIVKTRSLGSKPFGEFQISFNYKEILQGNFNDREGHACRGVLQFDYVSARQLPASAVATSNDELEKILCLRVGLKVHFKHESTLKVS